MPENTINNQGSNIRHQLIGSTFNGPVTIKGNTVIYEKEKQLPRRLTALPSLQTKLIGRTADLEQLSASLTTNQTVALVRGMGGVGKTTLATAYLQANVDDLAHTVWISQTTDFATSLLATDNLPTTLGIPITDNPNADAQNLLREFSRLAGPSLLVIDNAEPDVDKFLPYLPGAPNWKVLITARKTLRVPTNLQLDNLETEDAIALFRNHYNFQDDETIIRSIVTDVGGHALTIELLAKTAQKLNLSLPYFYDTLKEKGLAINRQANVSIFHAGTEEVPKIFPYLLAIFEMSDLPESAQRILYQFTILPSGFLSFDRLKIIFQLDPKHEEKWDNFNHDLTLLADAGWMGHDPGQGYRIHQIVQHVAYEKLKNNSSSNYLNEVLININDSVISYDQHQSSPSYRSDILAFGEGVLKNRTRLPKNSNLAFFLNRIASLMSFFGRYQTAVTIFKEALSIELDCHGDKSIGVQITRSNLADVYTKTGEFNKAILLLEQAREHWVENDLLPHKIETNLAAAYSMLGEFDQAKKLFKSALKKCREVHEDGDLVVQDVRSNLAVLLRKTGNYREAKELLELAIKYQTIHLGEHDYNVQNSKSNLALCYGNLGEYQKAISLLKVVLSYDIDHFGNHHPNVQNTRSNLATMYASINEIDLASQLLETALKCDIDNLGEEHPNVQNRRSNLASVYRKQGRINEAILLLESAIENDEKVFGEAHPDVLSSKSILANLYGDLKRHDDAISLLQKILAQETDFWGEQHIEVQSTKVNLAVQYYFKKDYDKALQLAKAAHERLLILLGPEHDTVKSASTTLYLIQKEAFHTPATGFLSKIKDWLF